MINSLLPFAGLYIGLHDGETAVDSHRSKVPQGVLKRRSALATQAFQKNRSMVSQTCYKNYSKYSDKVGINIINNS